jgi:hypothetical protein
VLRPRHFAGRLTLALPRGVSTPRRGKRRSASWWERAPQEEPKTRRRADSTGGQPGSPCRRGHPRSSLGKRGKKEETREMTPELDLQGA